MPDAFTNKKLGEFLREQQVNELYLVGLDAAGCVFYTAKGGIEEEYNVNIITDSIALLAESKWNMLLQQYKKEGINLIESKDF